MRRIARELGWFAVFAILAVALTWPMATQLDTAVSDRGDPFLTTWIIDWVCWSLTHAPLDLYNAPIFHPHKYPLAYSENLVGLAIFVLPFHLLGVTPTAVHGLAMLFAFALSGYGAFVLARMITGSTAGALVGGIFFAFLGFRFDHLPHVHVINSGWMPLFLAALLAYRRSPTWRRAALIAITYVMLGLTNIYYLLFCSPAAGLTVVLWLIAEPARREARYWVRLAGAFLAGGLILLPFLLPYRVVAREYNMKRIYEEVLDSSATWSDWMTPTPASFLYGDLTPDDARSERRLFPGLLVLFLAAVAVLQKRREAPAEAGAPFTASPSGLLRALDISIAILATFTAVGWASRRHIYRFGEEQMLRGSDTFVVLIVLALIRLCIRYPDAMGGDEGKSLRGFVARSRFNIEEWSAALWIGLGFLGSWGLNAFFHDFLFYRVEVFQSLRVTARWAVIAYAGLAVWSALGLSVLLRSRTGWRRGAVAASVVAIAILEVVPVIRYENVEREPPAVYRWMSENRQLLGPTLELPMSHDMAFEYVRGATTHHVTLVNGTSGFEPPLHRKLREKEERNELDDEFLEVLEQNGVHFILVHVGRLRPRTSTVLGWLERHIEERRLAFVRRFDTTDGLGDWLFAIARNAPRWETLRGLQAPDGAGHLPDENLVRLFRARQVYNGSTFYRLDTPLMYTYVKGPLEISGWALSPSGIRSVTAFVDEGGHSFAARLVERGDVLQDWPWYRRTTRPGFMFSIPERPKGAPRDTDLYLEIADGEGNVIRTADFLFRWD